MTYISEEMRIFDKREWKTIIEELDLSPRQSEIVQLLFFGKSDKQISKELNVAVATVRTHLGRLFSKYKVQDRTELILYIVHHFRGGCRNNNCPRRQAHQACDCEDVKIAEETPDTK